MKPSDRSVSTQSDRSHELSKVSPPLRIHPSLFTFLESPDSRSWGGSYQSQNIYFWCPLYAANGVHQCLDKHLLIGFSPVSTVSASSQTGQSAIENRTTPFLGPLAVPRGREQNIFGSSDAGTNWSIIHKMKTLAITSRLLHHQ